MKLLTFTDIHSSLDLLKMLKENALREKVEVAVCCGDLSVFGMDLENVMKDLSSFPMDVVLVHGNHDDELLVKKLCDQHENLHYIHGSSFEKNGFLFLGYGGDGFAVEDEEFMDIEKDLQDAIDENKDKTFILVTHAPPHKTKLDDLFGGHCGNNSIRKFIEKNNIALALCGHIHENFGREDKIKETRVVNPGPEGKVIHCDAKNS